MQPIKWIIPRLSKTREEETEANRRTVLNTGKTFSFVMQGYTSNAVLGAVENK